MLLREKIRCFDGAVAIITGGKSAIGAAIGRELAKRGCEVVLAGYPITGVKQVTAEIQASGGTATAAEIDVTDSWSTEALLYATIQRTGRLDYLFNYAGASESITAFGRAFVEWDVMVERNLRGIIYGDRAAYQIMLTQGFGHIINVVPADSQAVLENMSYALIKHTITGFSNALNAAAASAGIRVSVLCPEDIRTSVVEHEAFAIKALDAIANKDTIVFTGYFPATE
jgi:NADP-dependent 3-hydroxy acid dehydrogenase YdfG